MKPLPPELMACLHAGSGSSAASPEVRAPRQQSRERIRRLAWASDILLVIAWMLSGCSSPAVRQQRLVAKPNMTFADTAVFTYNAPKLLPQLAPGFAVSGGAQNSGCTSCR